MTPPWITRAPAQLVVLSAITALMITALYLWQGPSTSPSCSTYESGTESINGHVYYCETIDLSGTLLECPWNPNGSWFGPATTVALWPYVFHLAPYQCYEVGGTVVSVTEPNGTTFFGETRFGGPAGFSRTTWFASDNETGIYQASFPGNITSNPVTLFLEEGQ